MRTRKNPVPEEKAAPPKNPAARVFADIAARSKSFRPARSVLRKVRAVPTIFPDVDRRLRVGGWPIDRVGVVHGPSSHGKTLLCHGIGLSFLRRGHIYCYVDAENTTPIDWLETLLGEHADAAAFLAARPPSFERAVDDVRRVANGVAEERSKGRLAPDTTCLFVVDSIRKLVPENIIERIKKLGAEGEKGSVDGFSGAAGRMRAALNAAWLDELVPLMHATGCAIVFVGRESDDPNADARDRQYGNDWKLTGGRGLYFDSSIVARVVRDEWMTVEEGGRKIAVGESHRVEIHKTKVAAHAERVDKAWFHTSTGRLWPEGYLRAKDVLLVGEEAGIVKRGKRDDGRKGSGIAYGGKRWRGEHQFISQAPAELLDEIEAAARAKFAAEDEVDRRADVVGGA